MKNGINKLLIGLIIICLFSSIVSSNSQQNDIDSINKNNSSISSIKDSSWIKDVQVYDMVALPPNDADKYQITVNGLWNGFIGNNLNSPFAFGIYLESFYSHETFTTDEEFVNYQHCKGYIVPATILTTQGHVSFQEEKLEDFACRSYDGQMIPWDEEANSFWMNSANPEFIDWCIQHGKKAIDAGADMIVLDEIQGNGLIPMFQWAATYLDIPSPGFSNHTIEGFRSYLINEFTDLELSELYSISDIKNYNLRDRIVKTVNLTYEDRIEKDPLMIYYFKFLEENNFFAKKKLIDELRNYSKSKGKEIIIGANSYTLGTNRPFGFWPKGLLFSEIVDCFTFENKYSLIDKTLPDFPRNKWLGWEKLAFASTGNPAIVLIDTSAVKAVYPISKPFFSGYSNYLAIHCAEAYANRGAFVNYFIKPWGKDYNWDGCKKIYDFIMNHKDLYDKESVIDSPVAVLYLYGEGMRTKTDTYLGISQALSESQIPFEVIYDGDNYYINESLVLDDLLSYELLIVPSVIDITKNQEKIIKEYVNSGGIAIVFDPLELGFSDAEGEIQYGNGAFYFMLEDIGYNYYHSYDEKLRKNLESIVDSYVDRQIIIEDTNRKVIAFPYYQPNQEKVTIHLVNYDHSKIFDIINLKENIVISIKKPEFDIGKIYMISSDFPEEIILDYTESEGYIKFTIPSLYVYNIVVLESMNKSNGFIQRPIQNGIYLFDNLVLESSLFKTVIIGNLSIKAYNNNPDFVLDKVEFYIDGNLKFIDEDSPYHWNWNKDSIGRHEICLISYDKDGNKAIHKRNVLKLI